MSEGLYRRDKEAAKLAVLTLFERYDEPSVAVGLAEGLQQYVEGLASVGMVEEARSLLELLQEALCAAEGLIE